MFTSVVAGIQQSWSPYWEVFRNQSCSEGIVLPAPKLLDVMEYAYWKGCFLARAKLEEQATHPAIKISEMVSGIPCSRKGRRVLNVYVHEDCRH